MVCRGSCKALVLPAIVETYRRTSLSQNLQNLRPPSSARPTSAANSETSPVVRVEGPLDPLHSVTVIGRVQPNTASLACSRQHLSSTCLRKQPVGTIGHLSLLGSPAMAMFRYSGPRVWHVRHSCLPEPSWRFDLLIDATFRHSCPAEPVWPAYHILVHFPAFRSACFLRPESCTTCCPEPVASHKACHVVCKISSGTTQRNHVKPKP